MKKKSLGVISVLLILGSLSLIAARAQAQAVTSATRVINQQLGQAQLVPGVLEFGPHTSSAYGVGVSYLVTHPSAPILVRFSHHSNAPNEVGFKEFREPTSAVFRVNGRNYQKTFAQGEIAEILVNPPPGGWFAGSLNLSTMAFDGTTNRDGSPHTIYETIIAGFCLIP